MKDNFGNNINSVDRTNVNMFNALHGQNKLCMNSAYKLNVKKNNCLLVTVGVFIYILTI